MAYCKNIFLLCLLVFFSQCQKKENVPNESTSKQATGGWQLLTQKPAWGSGRDLEVVEFQDQIWLINDKFPDWWKSKDGVEWEKVTPKLDLSKRYMNYVVFENELYGVGGRKWSDGSAEKGVWKSKDGIEWELVTNTPAWESRAFHQSLVFNGEIWLLGGSNEPYQNYLNDVWHSKNGKDWEQIENIPWEGRWLHKVIVFNNKIWLVGGQSFEGVEKRIQFKDVWSSENGSVWQKEVEATQWIDSHYELTTFQNKLMILGGSWDQVIYWESEDGKNWVMKNDKVKWSPRSHASAVIFNDQLFFIGGQRQGRTLGDVWVYNEN